MTTLPKLAREKAGGASSSLWGVFFVVGCVLIYVGFMVRGLDFGSCPVMGLNQVVSCTHMFPGTDIPITTAGNMVMVIGGVLVLTMLALFLHTRLLKR